ncbi:hypothetical protein BU54_07790 [Escherichia coli O45:H2 str. 2010C-4211]|nr:hypothetical protein BU57_16650 [Escherichia coli O121:H19 str. 2011C-3609]KDV58073.1 hypothetical protein BU54_07790 [Escherichia coli O45:H2 str. 2010C-4211]
MLDLTYQHQATTQLYVQALIGIFFLVSVKGISIYADMTLAAIIYLGMSSRSCLMSTSGLICFWKNWSAS